MKLIDPIDDIRDPSQRLEPVQKPARDVHLSANLIVEQEGHHSAEGHRARPGVDDHVQHGAIGTADQLRLTIPRSTVQSAAHSLIGP